MITIVDYKMGNPGSIRNMLKKLGHQAIITDDPAAIETASKLILPGVGAFDAGIANLERSGLIEPLNEAVIGRGVTILGICLGMQLMTRRSDEGIRRGLGWIAADTCRFNRVHHQEMRIPHMGWNSVVSTRPSPLAEGLPEDARFYFVHSYFVACDDPSEVSLACTYGHRFDAAFSYANIHGVQFHPEKSHRFGMTLLRNFAERLN